MNMNELLNQVFDKDTIINMIDDFEKELSNMFGFYEVNEKEVKIFRLHPKSTTFIFTLDENQKIISIKMEH